jgi:DNA-binding CsgD family transcriptional regulator
MISIEAFSELLEVLYSVPLQQERWTQFLALLGKHTQSEASVLLCANSRQALSVSAQAGSVRFDDQAYSERYAGTDPFRGPVLRNSQSGVFQDEELLPNEGILRTDIYRDLLAPIGLRYTTHMVLTVNVRRLEVVTIARTLDQGPMHEDCNRLLHLLLPHVQKALEIRHVLGVAQHRLAGAEAMADSSATPTFLITRTGRLLHHNAAAWTLLERNCALALRDGALIAIHAACKEPLRKFFHDAALPITSNWPSSLHDNPAHAFSLHRSSSLQPLQLLASPLPPVNREHSKADLVLLATDPEQPVNYPDGVLRALYGLTPAQTEIANGLLTGYTLDEIACLRKVSVGTVRQQLKSIMSKTGSSRQCDLVKLLMTLPLAARAE